MSKEIIKRELTPEAKESLLEILKKRFDKNPLRHNGIVWERVQKKLETENEKLWSLNEMEKTGGEPDVVSYNTTNDTYYFFDCSTESPAGRRSICYDVAALESRKEHKPKHSALGMAMEMGIEILNEQQYHELQKLGKFDTKTSSWVKTPDAIRKLGGALFGDCRYNHTFIYHNGAESYYAARGFRGFIAI